MSNYRITQRWSGQVMSDTVEAPDEAAAYALYAADPGDFTATDDEPYDSDDLVIEAVVDASAETGKRELAAALIEAADEHGTIQAPKMVPLAPGQPELHTTMTLRSAARALGVEAETARQLDTDWSD